MKKTLLFLGTIAVSAVTSGVTVWAVDRSHTDKIEYIEREVERTPALGSHFTAYEADKYPDLTYAAENAVKAVVNIEAIQQVDVSSGYGGGAYDPFFEFFGIPQGYGRRGGQPQTQERRAGGSGVIISDDGYIVTNNHVIEDATKLRVKLNDGRKFDAKVIGTDPTTDVALIKVEGKDLPTIPFGNSEGLRLGEWVLAIGSPFGNEQSVSTGIVSALYRSTAMSSTSGNTIYANMIQTDAAINPGNSGGALVNDNGELVGINSLIESYSGSSSGVGFAIPVNYAKNIADQIIDGKTPVHPYMGATLSSVNALNARTNKLSTDSGAYVASVVEDGPAAKAGIQEGDVITKLDDDEITSADGLIIALRSHEVGEKVEITLMRGKEEKKVTVELGSDEELQNQQQDDSATDTGNGGITDEQLRQYLEELLGQQGQGQGYGQGY